METTDELDTSKVRHWRSIITLIVFVLTNIIVLFPFHTPIYIPRKLWNIVSDTLTSLRLIDRRSTTNAEREHGKFRKVDVPIDFVTAPLIADLFLLAILAIGREEVHDGTVGADNIAPINIMVFFLSLAYIALSIDASGLIRYLALKVLQKGGKNGRSLFFYLYIFFFALASVIGNDPIVLSGTPFLAYMTRASSNIETARAWIFTQFAVANIASAILVSSNPTNLVLAGAFEVKFIEYTANVIVPVIITAIVLFPFLLWIVFRGQKLVPSRIHLHELPEDRKNKPPVNPNIPKGQKDKQAGQASTNDQDEGQSSLDSLEEVMNPFLDKPSAIFASVVMIITLIVILVINATAPAGKEYPVWWVTLPAAVLVFCWDVAIGWRHRHESRRIARERRQQAAEGQTSTSSSANATASIPMALFENGHPGVTSVEAGVPVSESEKIVASSPAGQGTEGIARYESSTEQGRATESSIERTTLQSLITNGYRWLQETLPTVMAVLSHLPLKLVPFALCMFVLVQALVTNGWVPVFAYGWNHWVNWTGVVGAIGGMGFISVILCNFAGTNIGTTILLCRIIQSWVAIHERDPNHPINQRTFWATVYSMAIGVNYGAFSIALSASLAGLLWRDILMRKGIRVGSLEFARVNAGALAGTTVDISLYPLDTLKTRLQSSSGFWAAGGFRGIYSGIGSVVVGSAPGAALFFVSYESTKRWLGKDGATAHMLGASVGEIAACAVRVPTEVIKSRAQAKQFPSSAAALQYVLGQRRTQGLVHVWRELYRGWGITVMREVPFTIIQFPLWEFLKKWSLSQRPAHNRPKEVTGAESAVYGAVSGAVAAGLTTPLDVLKTRMMLSTQRENVFSLTGKIWRDEGGRVFFSGIGPRTMWISIGGAVFLGSYTWASNLLGGR
ncbi:Arsenite efflux transporter -like, puative (AFU_orthologue AFUA_2G15090) [Lecanosticta acicola]|uniref:Arsenite efflux transporter -like, puative (AFU_orthologue AFUA_2G15090) n=1 Tax=Lecanosticta acicola TaxID=111012 RepID=A0AAI9EBN7_9PEZI|nr:Arsenite efflux transporter -like, puative (AFU_orthologue AFUA_2G15090) [Lecanosticta acicola]